jgi:hypothetical protein
MTNFTSRVREQGVALMMTLGILSLILILAMSFAFTARTNRMLSQTNADMTRARLLSKSALERVIADLGYTFHSDKYIVDDTGTVSADDRSRIFPATANSTVFASGISDYDEQRVWISRKGTDDDSVGAEEALTCLAGVPGKGRFPVLSTGDLSAISAGWEHRKEYRKQQDGSFRLELAGRIIFAVIDESGKIDPGGVLTLNQEPYWGSTPAAGFFDLDGDGSHDTFPYTLANYALFEETKIPRLGLSPQEIRLDSVYAEAFWKKLPAVGGTSPIEAADWFSWRHIAAGLPMTALTDAQVASMLQAYVPYSYDCESFMYVDYSVDPTNPVEKHRTDLWALDWNDAAGWMGGTPENLWWIGAFSPDDPGSATDARGPGNFRDPATGNIQAANTDPANPTGGVPAFGQFTTEKVTEATLLNIIDSGDEDNAATVLPSGNEWDITQVGCEIQPYLNEVAFGIEYVCELGPDLVFYTPGDATNDDLGTVSIMLYLELAEIYGTARNFHANAKISYRIEHEDDAGNVVKDEEVADEVVAFDDGLASDNAYTVTKLAAEIEYKYLTGAPREVKVTVTKLELNLKTDDASGTVFADYACPIDADDADDTDSDIWAEIDGQDSAALHGYISVQADDPRCNTLPTDWKAQGNAAQGYASATDGDLTLDISAMTGDINTDVNPSTGSAGITSYAVGEFDAETVTDPVNGLSTAHIANKPNFTFLELGAVHRGEPWRTINLHAFTKVEEDGSTTNQWREYTEGDAAILTQTKLGGFTETRGKVNANSADPEVWYQLLNGIYMGGDHSDPTSGGTQLSDARAHSMGAAVASHNAAANDRLLERGEIVLLPGLTDGTTDREQEELVCKLANLLTVRQNLFSIMVTAQAVKDTATIDAKLHNTIQYDGTNYCNILSEQRLLATVYRDAFTNQFRVVRVEYLED